MEQTQHCNYSPIKIEKKFFLITPNLEIKQKDSISFQHAGGEKKKVTFGKVSRPKSTQFPWATWKVFRILASYHSEFKNQVLKAQKPEKKDFHAESWQVLLKPSTRQSLPENLFLT